jgi:hypothetical protein
MRHSWMRGVGVMAIAVLALSACGGGSDGGDNGAEAVGCNGSAVSDTGLPADFPVPGAVTFTKASSAGPSQVVDGFATEEVEGMWNEWKEMLDAASYDVLFSEEVAPDDAEISYKGPETTGQIALRNDCGGNGKIAVHVTSRPN